MRVEQLLRDGAERFGAKVAIVSGRRHHSYRDLHVKSARLAAALAARGVARGDRIVVFMDNSFAAVAAAFAIWRAGAVVCPLDPAIGADVLAAVLNRTDAVGIVTEARLASTAAAAMAVAAGVKVVVLSGGDRSSGQAGCLNFEDAVRGIAPVGEATVGDADDAAIVLNLDDSSSEPQTLTHEDLVAAASRSKTPDDADVAAPLPLSSHYGLYQLLTGIKAGATQVLQGTSTFGEISFSRADRLQADARLALAG